MSLLKLREGGFGSAPRNKLPFCGRCSRSLRPPQPRSKELSQRCQRREQWCSIVPMACCGDGQVNHYMDAVQAREAWYCCEDFCDAVHCGGSTPQPERPRRGPTQHIILSQLPDSYPSDKFKPRCFLSGHQQPHRWPGCIHFGSK